MPEEPENKNMFAGGKAGDSASGLNGTAAPHAPHLTTLAPPPRGVCQVHLTFTKRDYCGRQLFGGTDRCYWHSESIEKYEPEAVASYFGLGIALKTAIEA